MCITSHALVKVSLCDKLMFELRLLRKEQEEGTLALWVELLGRGGRYTA